MPKMSWPADTSTSGCPNGCGTELEQPWTASRCLRLLRPIQSRISLLQKLNQEPESMQEQVPQSKRSPLQTILVSNGVNKRIRRTYSQKYKPKPTPNPQASSGSQSHEILAPPKTPTPKNRKSRPLLRRTRLSPVVGTVEFATPLLRRISDTPRHPNSQPRTRCLCDRYRGTRGAPSLEALRGRIAASHYRIYEAIIQWLDSFLRVTEGAGSEPHCRSLMTLCLRKIPQYLKYCDELEREGAERQGTKSAFDEPGASIRIYHELQEYGLGNKGWRPLRTLVRAHGISILQNGISMGLFHAEFCCLIAEHCIWSGAVCEGFELLKTFLCGQKYTVPKCPRSSLSDEPALRWVKLLTSVYAEPKYSSFILDGITSLLCGQNLTVDWLCTSDFRITWALALVSLLRRSRRGAGKRFMLTCIQLMVARLESPATGQDMADALLRTLVSTVGGWICSALGLGVDRTECCRSSGSIETLSYILERSIADSPIPQAKKTSSQGRYALVFAAYLVPALATASGQSSNYFQPMMHYMGQLLSSTWQRRMPTTGHRTTKTIKTSGSLYKASVSLVSAIAQSCGRASSRPKHEYVTLVCQQLEMPGLPSNLAKMVRCDGALLMASVGQDVRDVAFADALVKQMHADQGHEKLFSEWRWEESIGEWVVGSPESRQIDRSRRVRESTSDETPRRQSVEDGKSNKQRKQLYNSGVGAAAKKKQSKNGRNDRGSDQGSDHDNHTRPSHQSGLASSPVCRSPEADGDSTDELG